MRGQEHQPPFSSCVDEVVAHQMILLEAGVNLVRAGVIVLVCVILLVEVSLELTNLCGVLNGVAEGLSDVVFGAVACVRDVYGGLNDVLCEVDGVGV
jgi:hypothetical protein